jgi:viroplasmin and RNaseH domain-containing protein
MDQELVKLAHAAIKQLQTEKDELDNQLVRINEAVKLAFDMFHNGQIAAEQLEHKIKEYSGKSLTDLEVIKKASELTKVASAMNSFKLSSRVSLESTPEDRFTSFLMEDL